MKKLMMLCIIVFMFLGCDNRQYRTEDGYSYNIMVVDSCEYIYNNLYSDNSYFTHKGNCKFCIERNKKDSLR